MNYIYNQVLHSIEFNENDIKNIFGINFETQKTKISKLICALNENIHLYLEEPTKLINICEEFLEEDFNRINLSTNQLIDNLEITMIEKTRKIREEILSKLLMCDNFNVLMSNGCSLYAGSKSINNEQEEPRYKKILANFKFKDKKIQKIIQNFNKKDRPEVILDKLYEILSYYENIIEDEKASHQIEGLIEDFKKAFIEEYVLHIDYSMNNFHKLFLKRIVSRSQKQPRVNIFTLNYDLLIEKSAEELGIFINNGFMGFQNRFFSPSVYYTDVHLNHSDGSKTITKSINLYKLHGSLSWVSDKTNSPYGITEIQCQLNNNKILLNNLPNCIIYPIQTKKKHSLDLPYSEMFRQFVEIINKPNTTLFIIGYSFLDEHVNDIITNALANPNFNLVIFSYQDEKEEIISSYLKKLFEISREDSRITILSGKFLGNFKYIVKYLVPYPQNDSIEKLIYNTIRKIKESEI